VAVGAALIGAALIGAIVLIIVGSGGDDKKGPSPQEVHNLQQQVLGRTIVDPGAGISVREPKHWRSQKGTNLITLQSADKCLGMTFYGAQTTNAKRVLNDSVAVVKRELRGSQLQPVGDSQVGGIPTTSARITGRENGKPVSVLLSIGKGKRHTYLTQTSLGSPSCRSTLATAQVVLTSLQYTK
jgi:hypothetical protein